jgi:rRNA maturation endonuclease Nob1
LKLKEGKVLVLDTGAILAGVPLVAPLKCYTPASVVSEVRDSESRAVLEKLLESRRLEVLEPSGYYVEKAVETARKARTLRHLSNVDLKVIALALELKAGGVEVIVASDDYRVQETIAKAGIEFLRVRYKGIRRK